MLGFLSGRSAAAQSAGRFCAGEEKIYLQDTAGKSPGTRLDYTALVFMAVRICLARISQVFARATWSSWAR